MIRSLHLASALVRSAFLLALGLLAFVTSSKAQTVDAFDSGWYSESSSHNPSNLNYIAGLSTSGIFYRNFASFEIPTFSGPLIAASIRYFNPSVQTTGYNGYNGSGTSTFEVFGLDGINTTSLLNGLLTFADLAPSGGYLNSTTVSPASNGTWVTVDLSSLDALNLITAHSGQTLSFGGSLASESARLFGFSDQRYQAPQLVLVQGQLPPVTPVPEPSTYGLMGAAGLFGLAALRRRLRRKVA
jgi:hypothetical protein